MWSGGPAFASKTFKSILYMQALIAMNAIIRISMAKILTAVLFKFNSDCISVKPNNINKPHSISTMANNTSNTF